MRPWIHKAFLFVILLSLVLAACSPTPAVSQAEPTNTSAPVSADGDDDLAERPQGRGEMVESIQQRGRLICGARTDRPAFAYLDQDGRNVGFYVDFCRAIAIAVLDDPEPVEIVTLSGQERQAALQTAQVDVIVTGTTLTSSREAQWGNFTHTILYDGQGFLVRADSGIEGVEDMEGATVCMIAGSTIEQNTTTYFAKKGVEFDILSFEDASGYMRAYLEGRCDVATSDLTGLTGSYVGLENPEEHVLLKETISKEPLTPIVPAGDEQWTEIVKVVIWGLINAEELGITKANVEEMVNSPDADIRRLLGSEGSWGQEDLGLPLDVMVRIIRYTGNYGEIWDNNLGVYNIERGLNALWTEGGLMYAPPMR